MTDIRTSPTGANVSSLAIVSADQETIIGDGTPANPLRLAVTPDPGNDDFTATQVSTSPVLGGVVRAATANSVVVSFSGDGGNKRAAAAVGLTVELLGGASISIRSRGLVELTTAQWDVVTLETGGLAAGGVYYVSSNAAGELSQTPGTGFIAQVGVALNATTMLVGLPAHPILA